MRVEPISLGHREFLDKRLKNIGGGLSDYSFANLYLFRKKHAFELYFDKDEIWVRGKTYDGFTYIMPTREPRAIDPQYLRSVIKDTGFLFPVPSQWTDLFSSNEFQMHFDDAESDYIYEIPNMVTYSGNKLHKKRNLLKQFMQGYEHQSYPLIEDHRNAAREILDEWQDNSGQDKQSTDYYSCLEALQLSEELVLCGMIYYVDKEPAGFALGEELTPDMFDIKFAKAKKKFKGVYQYLYNDFAKLLDKKYAYFNFEEDLGTQALRAAKSSYKPSQKLLKYRVNLK